jgi:uncharacterized protein YciI
MAQYVMMCFDKPGALALRQATREAHLAYMATRQEMIRLGGPMLDEGGDMKGSLLIVEAPDIETVRAFNAADPYTLAGLFERVEIHAWRQTVGPKS